METIKVFVLGLVGLVSWFLGSRLSGMIFQNHQTQAIPRLQAMRTNQEAAIRLMIQLGKSRGLSDEQIKLLIYQSAHETNNWDSVVYFANNNFFGMRMPRVRKTLASRELNGYAFFDSLNDSFNDMLLYLNYVSINIPNDATFSGITEYANLLKEKDYYTDSFVNYSAGMQNRKNKLDFVFNSIINKLL